MRIKAKIVLWGCVLSLLLLLVVMLGLYSALRVSL